MHHVGEVMLDQPGPSYVVAVTLESDGKDPLPALTIGGKVVNYAAALMTWSQAERLAGMLADAKRRYA
jgi:hypothetical protein